MRELESILEELNERENVLIRKLLVFVSPVTGDYDYRVSYFVENYEANIWEADMERKYTELGLTHYIYTDLLKR